MQRHKSNMAGFMSAEVSLCIIAAIMLSGCADEQDAFIENAPQDYSVTASVVSVDVTTRMADSNSQTVFQTGDTIVVSVPGGTVSSYRYVYTGTGNVFRPATGNYGLWKKMAETTSAVTVGAWYGGSGFVPAAGATVTASADQSTMSKFLKNIYMSATTAVDDPVVCKSLNFAFSHLMACLNISVSISDAGVAGKDVMGAGAVLVNVKNTAVLNTDTGKGYKLVTGSDKVNLKMRSEWNEQNPYKINFKCLLQPQTLPSGQKIELTLGNGKSYVCTLNDGATVLTAGYITTLPVNILP